ncbi:MAG: M18 family aminopeptidase [Myxococcota bacterium]
MDDVLARFLTYLDRSVTPQHAVATSAAWLDASGFREFSATDPLDGLAAGTAGYLRQGGTLFAFRVGTEAPARAGFRLIAAHTDSPNLRIKPQPASVSGGYVRVGVEVYGGAQIATWVDRDLGIAGAVHLRGGSGVQTRLVEIRRPVARVPTLAIHLNRSVNEDGLKLNAQTQLPAVLALAADGPDPLRRLIAEAADCAPDAILTWDLSLFDLTPAAIGGANGEFVFSGRLDNLGSCHAALTALVEAAAPVATSVVALFDHEEIGSHTNRGADGRALEMVLGRLAGGALDQALVHTVLVSADMAHALHPAFPDKSEPDHAPKLNGGPAIKTNANVRYSTEGATAAMFVLLCEAAEVPYQWYVHRSDLACGSTVGPLVSSRLGVRSVDVGNPMLSMHSIREQCGSADHARMARVMARFLTAPAV